MNYKYILTAILIVAIISAFSGMALAVVTGGEDPVFDSNYTWERWDRFPGEGFIGVSGNVVVGDVDNDGSDEIVCVGSRLGESVQNRDILIYELNGTYRHYENITSTFSTYVKGSIHDIDNDGYNELLVFLSVIGGHHSPGAGADLFRFNTTNVTESKLGTITSTDTSNNPKDPAWFNISGTEHFYTEHCGQGDLVNNFINFTTDSKAEIDNYANSGEASIAWDIDGDGNDELITVEGWNTNAAKVWMYEINNVTGAYTSKTLLFDNDLVGGQHWTAGLKTGDIDNDGIDNLILLWAGPSNDPYYVDRIEAYEFDGITQFGEGNYSEGFLIANSTDLSLSYNLGGASNMVIGDVDNDGKNELVFGFYMYEPYGNDTRSVLMWDIGTNGTPIQKTYLANFTSDYMGGSTYERHTITPAIFNHNGKNHLFLAVNKQSAESAVLETEFFVLTSDTASTGGAYNITLPLSWSIIGWTNPTASMYLMIEANVSANL